MLRRALGGRSAAAAASLVAGVLLLLIVPTVLLTASLIESGTDVASSLQGGALDIPPPPASVADWPVVGDQVHGFWTAASKDLGTALSRIDTQLKSVGLWLLETVASTGIGLVMFALSLVIAGALLSYDEPATDAARRIARRLAPERGDELIALTAVTVQSVTRGILGVALIQSVLSGLAMLAVGVPAAALWAIGVFLLAVVQVPTVVLLIPVAIYVFYTSSTVVAVLFLIWSIVVGSSDNVLKPMLLGRGVDVPMLVIFMGAIGGFILNGIIGLFVGAVVLAVGYTLLRAWLEDAPPAVPG
jgi:predicted PurR-regulated permease PerM